MSNELATMSNGSLAVSDAQRQIMSQSTPIEEVRFRKGRGGKEFPYTDTAYVIRTLNLAFGWDWDFEADNEEILYIYPDGVKRPYEARCRGRLTVRVDGKPIIKTQFGSQAIEFLSNSDTPVSLGDAYKGAASDALKKCASLLGISLDLYDSDSKINLDVNKAKQQQVQAKQQTAKPPVTVEQSKAPAQSAGSPTEAKSTSDGIPNSPKLIIEAVTKALGQDYYKAPQHLYNAIGKYPNSNDLGGWADYLAAAIAHAELRSAEKANETQTN